MSNTAAKAKKTVYVVGTFDTKSAELLYVRDRIAATGISTTLVDVGTQSDSPVPDITSADVADCHPEGAASVFVNDRGQAITQMALAFQKFTQSRHDIDALLGLGGSGGTAIITPAMRNLPVGTPKLMVSTMASSDVSSYVGASDLFMLHPITDLAGLNRVLRPVLANAAHAIAGMVSHDRPVNDASKPALGLTMFGVTTPCLTALSRQLESTYDCLVFHATGTGGRAMEHLVDAGELSGVLDITTTEVCDFLLGGVLSAGEDRLGAMARTGIPYVGSCGALDMVNFRGIETVPEHYKNRNLYVHNAQVTLMRTNSDEGARIGRWIGQKLNACNGPVEFLLPLRGLSSIDVEGGVFYDPQADAALFDTLEQTVQQTETRKLRAIDAHINDPEFATAAVAAFSRVMDPNH